MERGQVVRLGRWAVVLMAGASLAACATLTPKYAVREGVQGSTARPSPNGKTGTNAPYQVGGIWYVPHDQPHYDETGIASWYGDAFQLKATADGEIFDMHAFSAAHTTLPLPSMVEVTNLDNGRKMTVRVNDRGPFVGGRILDLSHAAARELGYDRAGTAHVRVRYVGPAPLGGPDAGVRHARTALAPDVPIAASGRRPADEDIFADAAQNSPPPRPLVKPAEAVSVAELAPLPSARSGAAASAPAVAAFHGDGFHDISPGGAFRIQAGAFGDQDNARKAVAQLAATGTATIEPIERGGQTLYRVTLPGPADEADAYALRDKVAGIGFADARVVRP